MSTETKKEDKEGCCPPGTPGAKPPPAKFVPKGTEMKLGDLPVYVTGGPSECGILVIQEVFGIKSGRLEQICDEIAAAGFVVAMADYHRGENLTTLGGDFSKVPGWLAKTPLTKIESDWNTHLQPLLESKGAKKFGAVGFCYGAVVVLHLAGLGKLLAGASCHPSHARLAPMYGTTPGAMIDAVKCPILLYPARNDGADQKPGGVDEKALKAKPFGDKCEVKEFTDVDHGWVTRGDFADTKVPNERDYHIAMNGVINFFKKNVCGTSSSSSSSKEGKTETKEGESCCPPGTPGAKPPPPKFVPKGTETKLGDLPVYITGDRSEYGVLVVQEVFGIKSGRLEQICDTIAAAGFVVAMADFHRGENFQSLGFTDFSKVPGWLSKTPLTKIEADCKEHVWPALAAKGATKFAAVGFCFGSVVVLHLSGTGKLSAGASCHPSHGKLAGIYGITSDALVGGVKCPQLMYAGRNDGAEQKPGGSDEKTLSTKSFASKCEFKEFKDVDHGWVPRIEFTEPNVEKGYNDALNGVIAFFKSNMASSTSSSSSSSSH